MIPDPSAGSPVGPDTGVHAPGARFSAAPREGSFRRVLPERERAYPHTRKCCCGFREIRTEAGVKGYEAHTAVILTSLKGLFA